MTKTRLGINDTGYFSKLIMDYLEGKEGLASFYDEPPSISSFQRIIKKRSQLPLNRKVLVESLIAQNEGYEVSDLTNRNIQSLLQDNCYTVTTGHQLNLFTGPLYFVYKIVSVINLAKKLKINQPDVAFVPVYWMASEDHDFEEINHFNLFKKRYQLASSNGGAVGQMKLEGVDELLSQLKEDLGDRTNSEEIIKLFSRFYQKSKTYAEATRGIVNHLFGKYGVVIIDGNDASLKSLMMEEFKAELLERNNHKHIQLSSQKLRDLGFKPQLNPREINLFYLKEGLRERIVFEDGIFKVLNTSIEFSEKEIVEQLEKHPERFSPNAPMRCMYQEKILPNLAYVGGGGELAYWFQLKQMFERNSISYPVLVLRNSVLIVDKGSGKRISKLGVDSQDLFKETDELIKGYLHSNAAIDLALDKEEKVLEKLFVTIADKASFVDGSLSPMIKAELQKSLKSIKNIENRLMKAEKKKEEVGVGQLKSLKEKLFPGNSLQERHDNLISLFIHYGDDLMELLIDQLEPLNNDFIILNQ